MKYSTETIIGARKKIGFTQRKFGELIGVSGANLNRWEHEQTKIRPHNEAILNSIIDAIEVWNISKEEFEKILLKPEPRRIRELHGWAAFGLPPEYPAHLDDHLVDHQWGNLCDDLHCEFNRYNMKVRGLKG